MSLRKQIEVQAVRLRLAGMHPTWVTYALNVYGQHNDRDCRATLVMMRAAENQMEADPVVYREARW